ncbi:hypothetical protein F3J27_22725, partial [Enterobacter sp. Ap-916]|uniref:hypothetical protein n=1 Tax=Enterobacter sp. Ap-916 TaxID=2608344 RepID=UPI0014214F8B
MKNRFILLCLFLISCKFFAQTRQVGINTASPQVLLDARANNGNSAIAFGNTNQNASNAGAGAMKYSNGIYYSNGVVWQQLIGGSASDALPKVVAAGRKNVDEVFSTDNPEAHPWIFQDITLNDGNWDPTIGYTVPTSGYYQLSMGCPLKPSQSVNTTNWTIFIYTGTTEERANVFYGQNISTGGAAFRGGTTTLYLTAGQVIKFGS